MSRPAAIVIATLVALLAILAGASAAPAAKWRKVTSEGQPSSTSEVGLERTADGVLHVAWSRNSGATEQVMHSAIAANGKSVSAPDQIASTNLFVNRSVDLVPGPGGGLRAFFTGLFATTVNDELRTATAPAGGSPWAAHVAASSTASSTNPAQGAGIGAALSPTSGLWSAWGDSSPNAGGYHVGTNPADGDFAFPAACCERDPNVAADSLSGVVAIAWNYLPIGGQTRLQVMVPFVSPPQNAPKSGAAWTGQRVGLSGRIGAGGIYAAYGSGANPFNARPALWRVGAAKAKVLKTPRDAEHTTLAPAPGGRLWLAWEGKDRGKRIFAARTNPKATKFGAIVATRPPLGTEQIHRLAVEGSRGFLDLVALADRGGSDIAHWHARLRPGLSLRAKPRKVPAGSKATFRVSDAGTPVAGAKVRLKLGGTTQTKTTNANGKAKIAVPGATRPGRYPATATKPGYAAAKRKLKVT